jgi:hypothetical protein
MVRIIPRTRNTMHGTPGFICGGAADFGLKALYLPIRGGGYKFRSNCYAYGRDLETTPQFTIRMLAARGLRFRPSRETRHPAIGIAGLETVVPRQVGATPGIILRRRSRLLEGHLQRLRVRRRLAVLVSRERECLRSRAAGARRGADREVSGRPVLRAHPVE